MFTKTFFTRRARVITPTSKFQPGPSPRRLVKRSKVRGLKHLLPHSHSPEDVNDADLQEPASPEPSIQEQSHSCQGFNDVTQEDPQFKFQDPHPGSPTLTPSPTDLSTFLPAQAGEDDSATSTPPSTFSAATFLDLATPESVPTTPTSSGPSSPHSFEQHPDLIAVNQRIAELEAIAEQIELEHADYVKEAKEMDATLTTLEEEVQSAIDAIKAVNRKTSALADEEMKLSRQWWDEFHATCNAEDELTNAKLEYEAGQKKYAELQVRYENLQREREQQRHDAAAARPPNEPWLEVLSAAVAPNLLAGVAFGIGHLLIPFLSNSF